MAIEHTRDDNAVSLRCKLLVGAVYTALGTLAIAAGVWGGSRFTTADQQRVIVYAHNVGGEAQPCDDGLENVADGRPKTEYAPFVSVKIDTDFFALMVDHTGTIHEGSAISGTGFGDVYDQRGRLVRRYAAVEDTNSSWELMEFMPLPRRGPRTSRKKKFITRSRAQIVAEQELGGR